MLCLSETELLSAEALLREQFYADGASTDPRTPAELLADSVAWTTLTESQKQAVKVRQLCNQVVILGVRTDCSAEALAAETKCYCSISKSQLQAIIAYLECLQQQT